MAVVSKDTPQPSRFVLVSLAWNKHGWKAIDGESSTGHAYTQEEYGHENLNFNFEKSLDDPIYVYGYSPGMRDKAPRFLDPGIVFFYSRNYDKGIGQIVGVYGNAKCVAQKTVVDEFDGEELVSNIKAEREYSILFPTYLDADKYKLEDWKKIMPQGGKRYLYGNLPKRIIEDAIKGATRDDDKQKLRNIGVLCDKLTSQSTVAVGDAQKSHHTSDIISGEFETGKYNINNIINDGCFLDKTALKNILNILKTDKNIILQGPPGTGKTWLAKRLGYVLVGEKSDDDSKIRPLQFHPNMSYEDFVRGWRPSLSSSDDNSGGGGRLQLVDGPLLDAASDAKNFPDSKFVLVIEEINRGNPANIFGEMLTLLEADKRHSDDALRLCYPRFCTEKVHLPDNLYIIGTMNVADRSIALVDLALRRRFGFYNLEPTFNRIWEKWLSDCGVSSKMVKIIKERLESLNDTISKDMQLGPHYRVGHSHVTPASKATKIEGEVQWFEDIVKFKIGPLLEEYWVADKKKACEETNKLLKDLEK